MKIQIILSILICLIVTSNTVNLRQSSNNNTFNLPQSSPDFVEETLDAFTDRYPNQINDDLPTNVTLVNNTRLTPENNTNNTENYTNVPSVISPNPSNIGNNDGIDNNIDDNSSTNGTNSSDNIKQDDAQLNNVTVVDIIKVPADNANSNDNSSNNGNTNNSKVDDCLPAPKPIEIKKPLNLKPKIFNSLLPCDTEKDSNESWKININ